MSSRIRRLKQKLFRLRYMPISLKLTFIYASILSCIMILTSLFTLAGLYYVLYHQAEMEIQGSSDRFIELMEAGMMPLGPGLIHEDILMPGVVLRVKDMKNGNIIFDSAEHYPSIETAQRHMDTAPPFLANKSLQVVTLRNMQLYYRKCEVVQDGKKYELHFFKIITAERLLIQTIANSLIYMNLLGFLIALVAGFLISRRILQPIRTITKAARAIEITDLDKRIEVLPTHDELAELADTFNHMLNRIQNGFEQQRRFVSDASHELRTPVTVISGYSDMLSRWGRRDEAVLDEGIAAIKSEAVDMQGLIEKLLFLARTDQKRQVLHKERTDIQELLEDVVKKTQLIAKKHHVVLATHVFAEVYVDAIVMKQMLRIFLENSIKYTPAGGVITVSSSLENGQLKIVLQDTGIGISKENHEKVFDRFYRVDSARTKEEGGAGGTGLGLSIAKWIAEQHNIVLDLESDLGKGTKIILTVPLYKD